MLATEVYYYDSIDGIDVDEMRQRIEEDGVCVVRNVFTRELCDRIVAYLSRVAGSSLPNYSPIELGCPNFHRLNRDDERSYVKACFHQFSFFPWNQDVFDFFELARPVYQLRNRIVRLPADHFLGRSPDDGCSARVTFQFYPSGSGHLHRHQDPYDFHQLTVPTMALTKKGDAFHTGGAYAMGTDGPICTDEIADPGDVVFFNAQIAHGVEMIDRDKETDWLSFRGRWMMLFAVNRLTRDSGIADAVDLEADE